MRVVIAEDSVLLREGLERLLTESGLEVVAPDVAIVDIRLPPTHSDEVMRAAPTVLAPLTRRQD